MNKEEITIVDKGNGYFREWFDWTNLVFRIAKNKDDFNAVYECRARGYSKYGSDNPEDWIDRYDDYATQYMCQDDSGQTLGCMRMISSKMGPIPIQDYMDISLWTQSDMVYAELARLCVPLPEKRPSVKFGLWVIAFLDALRNEHTHFVIGTNEWLRSIYEMIGFKLYPGHPNCCLIPQLNNLKHYIMSLDLCDIDAMLSSPAAPLYRFTVEKKYSNVILD